MNGTTLTADLVTDGRQPQSPAISPDGRLVAWAETGVSVRDRRAYSFWVRAADGATAAARLLEVPADGHAPPQWAADSGSLFLAAGGTGYRADVATGAVEEVLTWHRPITTLIPLAGQLAFVAPDEPAGDQDADRGDAIVWGGHEPPDRLRFSGRSGATVAGALSDRHVVDVAARPDGAQLATISWAVPQDEPGAFTARLHIVDVASGQATDLGPVGLETGALTWWRATDGWHVCYLAAPPGPSSGRAVYDVSASGQDEHDDLTAGMTVCPVDLARVASGPPLALFADGLDTGLYRLDPGTRRFGHIVTRPGDASSLSASDTGQLVALRQATAYQPPDVHSGPAAGQLTQLSDSRPHLRGVAWGAQERLAYTADDGLALDGILVLPPGRTRDDGPFPLVTVVHGGPYYRSADEFLLSWAPSGQWLASGGYAVFLPNPRGGMGHGSRFAAMVGGAVGTDEWTDILTGIDVLVAEGVADPARLGIAGWSHGGFMAAWAVGQTDRFRAAVMGAGIADWGIQVACGEFGVQEAELGGSTGWQGPGPHRHDRLSPISYASRVRTPVLILHGQDDTNVPLAQASYFHRALYWQGVEHELVVYPREGHAISERDHQIDILRRTRAWFDRWLGTGPDQAAAVGGP